MAKPISTLLSDGCIFVVRLFEFILFGNPLSMCVFNFFAPRRAAKYARNPALFGENVCAFYEKWALKWPFFWARWWMKLDIISQYPIDLQVKYFFKVAVKNKTEVETLKAMQKEKDGETFFWPDVYDTLFFKYGHKELPYTETRSHMEGECCVVHCAYVTVAEFMMRHVRLSWYALQNVIEKAAADEEMRDELKKYLSRGKLNDSQFELLINAVTTDPGSGDLQMLGVLLGYIESYGISEKHELRIKTQFPQPFVELVIEKSLLYEQLKLAKSYKNTKQDKDAWCQMCEEMPKIFPEVQSRMSCDQYIIFNKTGHTLDAEAILQILKRNSDLTMTKLIFKYEPHFGIANDDIKEFVSKNQALQKMLDAAIIAPIQKDLRLRIYNREELTEEQMNKMFDCPDAGQLVLDYISFYPLPKKLHQRMLELDNAEGVLGFYIMQSWLLSDYQLEEAVLEKCKELGLRLDPPEGD